MVKYSPLKITGNQTGLVQSRENFILPNDAYPILKNAYVWRERILRKKGPQLVGRLQRDIAQHIATTTTLGVASQSINLYSTSSPAITPGNATIVPGSVVITINGGNVVNQGTATDDSEGSFIGATGNIDGVTSSIDYKTGIVNLVWFINPIAAASNIRIAFSYYPNLPVTGILTRDVDSENYEETIFFDTKYAYKYNQGTNLFQEYISGTTWNGTSYQLFYGSNYWVDGSNRKLFWVTNFNIDQSPRDPIRYTNGVTWTNFAPNINDGSTTFLNQAKILAPFRSRFLAFNTVEGNNSDITLSTFVRYRQRIRWSAIGNPLATNAWASDIPGKGGFLDIPTNQDIISVGFVRDNLVIYCERSTWQLRYTGRSIQPFQIERVNSELGTEATFSSVQFDTSLISFGDKGIIQCDSFKTDRIDIKIPDLVFDANNDNNSNDRIYGIRDFQNKLAFWTYAVSSDGYTPTYPNKRLLYNYENDSWGLFDDSITAMGTFQDEDGYTWANSTFAWKTANFPWKSYPALFPSIVGGNQQGFIFKLDMLSQSEPTLFISGISSGVGGITVIESPDHNLYSGQIVKLTNMGDSYSYLEDLIVWVERTAADPDNSFEIYIYSEITQDFDDPVPFQSAEYLGNGLISVRDNFTIQSKKFNFIDEGENIQLGYIDILFQSTPNGEVTLNIYNDYNDFNPVNTTPENTDAFFNSAIPTYEIVNRGSTKNWQRIYCASRSSFITTEFTLSPEQMNGVAQENLVQIDAQVMWIRKAGRQLPFGE